MKVESVWINGRRVSHGIVIDDKIPPPIEEVVAFAREKGATYYMGEIEIFVIKRGGLDDAFFKGNYWAVADKLETARCLSQ